MAKGGIVIALFYNAKKEKEEIDSAIKKCSLFVFNVHSILNFQNKPMLVDGVYEVLVWMDTKRKKRGLCSDADVNELKKYLLGADPELLNFFPLFCRVTKEDFIKRGSCSQGCSMRAVVAEKLETCPSQCVAIETTAEGVESAVEAGMTVIFLTTVDSLRQNFSADVVLTEGWAELQWFLEESLRP